MTIVSHKYKAWLIFILGIFLVIPIGRAQNKGILPLTGLRYFSEGISVKSVDVKIDGAQLMGNRIPLNKEIEVKLQEPMGFIADQYKTMFAGAEVIIVSPKGEPLFNNPNVFLKNYSNGFYIKDLNSFSIKFGIGTDLIKGNLNGILKIRLFDMKGKSQLRMEMPVTFARPGEKLQVSKTAKTIKSHTGVNGIISGLKARDMMVKIDTTISVSPKMAYTSMDIAKIEGSSLSDIFQGKEKFWVYDSELNEVKISDILLKQVKGTMEGSLIDYTIKIPYRLKTNITKNYTVRFRWESMDKSQVIDIVVVI